MRDARAAVLGVALAAVLALAGCAGEPRPQASPEVPAIASDASTANPMPGVASPAVPSPAAEELVRPACTEAQSQVSAPADDFAGLPDGYTLVLDGLGRAILAFVHQQCDLGGTAADTVLTFVLLDPPEAMRREGATHGGLVMAWTDDDALLDALLRWDVAAQRHALDATVTTLDVAAEVRVQGEPDFVLTVQGAGHPATLPFDALRLIDFDDGTPGGVFDRVRPGVTGLEGPATVSLLLEPEIGDFPDHRAGFGSIMTSPSVDVVLSPGVA